LTTGKSTYFVNDAVEVEDFIKFLDGKIQLMRIGAQFAKKTKIWVIAKHKAFWLTLLNHPVDVLELYRSKKQL
jgi:hypothetical protein